MVTDTKGLSRSLEGAKLRLFFQGGEVCEAILLSVNVHEDCRFGDEHADFFYDVVSSNRLDKYREDKAKTPKPVYSSEFKYLDRWELVDSMGAH